MIETKNIQIKNLELNSGQLEGLPKNPRLIRDEKFEALLKSISDAPEMLNLRELLVFEYKKGKYIVIGGNMRLKACKELGYSELPCKILPAETPLEKLREYTIKDNNNFGEYDWDLLASDWDSVQLEDWGVDLDWDEQDSGSAENEVPTENEAENELEYSRKIVAPVYEPNGQKPLISDCINTDKRDSLIAEIDSADIPDNEKKFLKECSQRFIDFQYDKIADYYANSDKKTQALMERLALVIIDFDKAIEAGFVRMTEKFKKEVAYEYKEN